jgi:DNA-3-methyladenine glycosylase II
LSHITFSLDPIPPFRLDLTAWALRRRPQNEVDFWDGETYRRVLVIRRKAVLVGVTQTGGVDAPRLEVTAIGSHGDAKNAVVFALERLLGLRIDLTAFYELAAKQPRLHELSTRFRGVKPPRFPTVWEGIVNGVACQQLSLTVGVMLLNRLSSACGLAFTGRNRVPGAGRPCEGGSGESAITRVQRRQDSYANRTRPRDLGKEARFGIVGASEE